MTSGASAARVQRSPATRLRSLVRDTAGQLRGHDLSLYAAGVTFYAGIAVVPLSCVAVWAASQLVGDPTVAHLGGRLAAVLPGAMGAPAAVAALIRAGQRLTPATALVALFPASFYGEGLRRAFVRLAGRADSFVGWRGRLSVLPLLALAPLLLVALLAVTPTLARLFGAGGSHAVLGVYVALNLNWVLLTVSLAYSYRVVAPGRLAWRTALLSGSVTGAVIAGFVEGFVLFLAIPVDLGGPFAGFVAVGAMAAVGFWLWLLHLLVLVGYGFAHALAERAGKPVGRIPSARPALAVPGS